MRFDHHLQTQNLLLAALPPEDLERLIPFLAWADYEQREEVSPPGAPQLSAYFPVSGIVSIIAETDGHNQAESAVVGREGFLGTSIILLAGHDSFRMTSQVTGRGLRLPAEHLLAAFDSMPRFRAVLLRYAYILFVQAANTVLANSSYTVEERLARWILMTQDRSDSVNLTMTHEFVSIMLAVRRPGVTEALNVLEGKHLIRATRGNVKVIDRKGLEDLAGNSYGQPEREYSRLITH